MTPGNWSRYFPEELDPIIMPKVKPTLVRGDDDMIVFAAFEEVEICVRAKDPSLAGESGVDLMNKAFRPSGPL